jgi:hypothetical protein
LVLSMNSLNSMKPFNPSTALIPYLRVDILEMMRLGRGKQHGI